MGNQLHTWLGMVATWLIDHGLRIAFILAGAFLLYAIGKRLINRLVRLSVVRDALDTEAAEKQREDTLIRIFDWAIRVVITLVAGIMSLQEIGISIGPILAGAGIAGIALGFGGQYLIRDYLTGFFMILENQYRIGDVVSLDQTSGQVEDISLRMTTLRDLDGTVHHVPHGDVKRVSNQSKHFARINLNVAVSYQAPMDKVIRLINQVGQALAEDEQYKPFILRPPQFLRVEEITPAAMIVKILGETAPLRQWEITGELRRRLILAFEAEGIALPPSQILLHHNPQHPFSPE